MPTDAVPETERARLLRADFEAAVGASTEVGEYLAWLHARQPEGARGSDDVALRDYLLELRTRGVSRPEVGRTLAALKRFYGWAFQTQRLTANPFDAYNFDRPWLSREQIRKREQSLGDPQQRELIRLRALNRLAEDLHRAPDVRATIEAALTALVEVMGLRTAWAFLLTESGLVRLPAEAPHSFALVGACGLPPALEQQERRALAKPPDCHCQGLLRAGRLPRAVNVVECTRLQAATGNTQGLLFHATVPLSIRGRAVGLLNFATEEWQFLTGPDLQLLSAVGAHVSLALERARLYDQAEAQRDRLAGELVMARAVQASLLPARLPTIPGFTLAADWRSAHEVAGDFYDVLPLPEGRWGLVIADVADKGAAAALYMAVVHSRLRAAAERAASPAELLREVNRELFRQADTGMFVTVFYAVLDPAMRTLTYCNAGHNPPLHRHAGGAATLLPRGGSALGVLEQPRLVDATLTLAQGEALVLYTDGVTEALNPAGEEFGLGGLTACLAGSKAEPAHLLRAITDALAAFSGGAPLPDDVTLLVVSCDA